MNHIFLTHGFADGHYVLPPLPYDETALEPFIGAETLILHHDKHHASYVAGANAAADTLRAITCGNAPAELSSCAMQKLAFNLGGHVLHTLYWHSMTPRAEGAPYGLLAELMRASFGSYEAFCNLFTSVCEGVQGSGWGVLGVDPVSHKLLVLGISRHQDVLVPGLLPVLVCDVWEHAYYLTWRNNRKGYVAAFMQHINWPTVALMVEKALTV